MSAVFCVSIIESKVREVCPELGTGSDEMRQFLDIMEVHSTDLDGPLRKASPAE